MPMLHCVFYAQKTIMGATEMMFQARPKCCLSLAVLLLIATFQASLVNGKEFFQEYIPVSGYQGKNMDPVVSANNAFNWDLLKLAMSENQNGNVFLSPYSISTAVAMLTAASKGKTEKEFTDTFHWSGIGNYLHGLENAFNEIAPKASSSDTRFDSANKVFIDRNINILSSYEETLQKIFKSDIGKEDFSTNAEDAIKHINLWVADHTNGKIKDLFPSGSLDQTTKLALANAVYFKGLWKLPFDPNDTQEREFSLENGQTVPCQMMWKNGKFQFHFDQKLQMQVVKLPYAGDEFDFVAAVPTQTGGKKLSDLVPHINANIIADWLENLHAVSKRSYHQDIDVFLPKFKMEFSIDLKQYLQQLGVKEVFADSADLSGITGERNLYCGSAFHKAFIEVNEAGTEAGAATGMGIMMLSMPPQVMLDRPFLYFIVSRKTNAIVFSGRIADPRS